MHFQPGVGPSKGHIFPALKFSIPLQTYRVVGIGGRLQGTLLQLMGICVSSAQRFASIADSQVGDMNQQAAVGTTVALLERGSRVMSGTFDDWKHNPVPDDRASKKYFAFRNLRNRRNLRVGEGGGS